MKYLFSIMLCLLCISCTKSKYQVEIKEVGNDSTILYSDTVMCTERKWFNGQDSSPIIESETIMCVDTTYMFYTAKINDFVYINTVVNKTNKPIYFSKFKCIE